MRAICCEEVPFLSARARGILFGSTELRQLIAPEDPGRTPYEILEYDATLHLREASGFFVRMMRRQKVRFLQEGVAGLLDHAWGDGFVLSIYDNDAGPLAGAIWDEGRWHLAHRLPRPMHAGETFEFNVERSVLAGFMGRSEWLETILDHPSRSYRQRILFPAERPCRGAQLVYGDKTEPLSIRPLASGQTELRFRVTRPKVNRSVTVHWTW